MRGEVVGMGRSVLAWIAVALLGVASSTVTPAGPRDVDRRLEPSRVSPLPTQVRRVEPAVVGIRVEVEPDRPSAATLGTERTGSGVIFDADQGYVLTVSYLLLDAQRIQVSLRDGRRVPARLTGLDLEVGVGVARLEGAAPRAAAPRRDAAARDGRHLAGALPAALAHCGRVPPPCPGRRPRGARPRRRPPGRAQ